MSSPPDDERARVAYEAFASTQLPIPPAWGELPPWVRESWRRAVKALDERERGEPKLPTGTVYREDG